MKNLFLLFLLIPISLFSQDWAKTYGDEGTDKAYSVQQTVDGGYIISGYTSLLGSYSGIWLIKTDSFGDTLWTKIYGGGAGVAVQQTTDEGYIITNPSKLIKTDPIGNIIWEKSFGGNDVKQTSDGGYILTGKINTGMDIFLKKTDSEGEVTWSQIYNFWWPEAGYSVQQTTDNGFILLGYTNTPETDSDFIWFKTDSIGNTEDMWLYGFCESEDVGFSLQQTSDGGYISAGYARSLIAKGDRDLVLIKSDSFGKEFWQRTYGGEEDEIGYSVQQTTDGGYIVVGSTKSYGNGSSDVYLIKTASNGDSLWSKTYGGANWDEGRSVQQTTDGGYIICGWTESYGNGSSGSPDVYLIKTDEEGIVIFTTEIPIPNSHRKLIKTIDISGKEIVKPKKNQAYIEIYDDGTTEKKVILK